MRDLGHRLSVFALIAALAACSDDGQAPPADAAIHDSLLDGVSAEAGADATPDGPVGPPPVELPRTSIAADELALIVNENDPQSVAVAARYQAKRKIPAANVIKLKFKAGANVMTEAEFKPLRTAVEAAAGAKIQALALTWMLPYRVDCMSITAAFALGFDKKYCNTTGGACGATAPVAYYAKESTRPYTDHGLRPTMMLAGVDQQEVFKLIDRGLAAEGTLPAGDGWMIRTTDSKRSNPRYKTFQSTVTAFDHPGGLKLTYIDNAAGVAADNVISNKQDVLFYFTGLTKVDKLETNTYRPGAVADHLTSYGGQLKDKGASGQMSVLRWLEAGVTGSYGTAVEPCAYPQKFPNTAILLPYYFRGNTLVEAYWKSVNWPGEGVFVGDPLARPFGSKVIHDAAGLTIRTTILQPTKLYRLMGKDPSSGSYVLVQGDIKVGKYMLKEIKVSPVKHAAYRLELVL
jgi:uncharacterized protein (TIGR03790 family)